MKHEMNLRQRYYDAVKNGTKTIELRLYDEKRRLISVGDTIEFSNEDKSEFFEVKVVALHICDSFARLYNIYSKTCFGYYEEEEASYKDMEKFYSKDDIAKYGVVGIEISLN